MRAFRATSRQQEPPQKDRTRTPKNPSGIDAHSTPSEAPQHVSQMAKRADKVVVASHKPLAATGQQAFGSSRAASIAPQAGVPSSNDTKTPASNRHNVPLQTSSSKAHPLGSKGSASNVGSTKPNKLRRKASTIEQYTATQRGYAGREESSSSRSQHQDRETGSDLDLENTILGIALPRAESVPGATTVRAGSTAETAYRPVPLMQDFTPPLPPYAQSATPSTRYTDSPFSHAPTPSSASSHSSAIMATKYSVSDRRQQQSPARPRRPDAGPTDDRGDAGHLGLPSVRESSTSSSNATVRPGGTKPGSAKREALQKASWASSTLSSAGKSTSSTSQVCSPEKPAKGQPLKPSHTFGSRAPIGIPPELAHLNVDPPHLSPNSRSAPTRPSRNGTPVLSGVDAPSPVVQSDLPRLYTSYHKRTPSQEAPTTASSPSLKTRFGFSSRSSSRQSSPRVDSAVSPPLAARTFARGPTPEDTTTASHRMARKDSPAVVPVPSKSPRFGFFSRKAKTDETKSVEKPQRLPSKGPAAGTGHEGYGRFSARGRSSSASSSAGARSPSTASTTSQPRRKLSSRKSSTTGKEGYEMDDFLRERLTPVVLRGSGSTLSNGTSNSDVPWSSKSSSLDSIPCPRLLPSAMEGGSAVSPARRTHLSRRGPSDDSDEGPRGVGTLSPPAVPPTANRHANRTLHDDFKNTARNDLADNTMSAGNSSHGKEDTWTRSAGVDSNRKGSRKWSFFQRAQASPGDKEKSRCAVGRIDAVHLVHQPSHRSIAHYAMVDTVGPVGLKEVEQIVRESETSPEDSTSETNAISQRQSMGQLSLSSMNEYASDSDFSARPLPPRIMIRQDSEDSSRLRSAETTIPHQAPHVVEIRRSPVAATNRGWQEQKALIPDLKPRKPDSSGELHTPDMLAAPFGSPDDPASLSPSRQPRLSPIGRIPKVVSKRDRERKLSDSSFSRPFVRSQPKPSVKPPGSLYNQIRELASPTESSSQPVSSTSTNSNAASGEKTSTNEAHSASEPTNCTNMDAFGQNDFFAFPRRNDSDVSYSSSSGNASVLAILAARPPQEDDIWNEYNDLLDEVMPAKARHSTSSSLAAPFQYFDTLFEDPAQLELQDWYRQMPPTSTLSSPRSQTVPAVLSVPQEIARFMQPSWSPRTTPLVLPDVFGQAGDHDTSTLLADDRLSGQYERRSSIPRPSQSGVPAVARPRAAVVGRSNIPQPKRAPLFRSSRSSLPSARGSVASSVRSSRSSTHSRAASLPEANFRNSQSSLTPSGRYNRDTQLLDIAEVDGDELAAVANLRYGALMTSKWLSFGRVLFSPAHHEVRLGDDPRVLIIDGLGSDWSYYVAISYPTATIYNLGPTPTTSFSDWSGGNERPPSNHRHITHAAISAAFPFPKGFFTAVIFRFPLVTTDSAYQACMYECKRVLRPGGFLEIASLDLDLMNMGNKARKELRGLKTRLQQRDQNIGLRNLSDMLVRLVGRRGFEDIQRCIVGVPTAGHIPKSQDMSSVSSRGSGKPVWPREDRQSQVLSFADLLEDARANRLDHVTTNDDNITKMVAKVGRWWYSTCYERSLLRTDHSIWNDVGLLRECEKQGTSFRLLICYAQKPAQTRRRTVSV